MNFVDLELKKVGEFNIPIEGSHPNLTLSQNGLRPSTITTTNSPKQPLPSPPPIYRQPINSSELTKSYGGGPKTATGIRIPPPQQDESSSPWLGIGIVMIAGLIGVFGLLNETQPRLVAEQCLMVKKFVSFMNCYESQRMASSDPALPKLKITTDPAGAAIFINSKPTGMKTPGEIEIDSGKPFTVSVALGGYRYETQKFATVPLKNSIYFKMTSVPSGVINVRIIGGKGYLNGQELSDGQRLTVEAGKAIQFKVINPFDKKEKMLVYLLNGRKSFPTGTANALKYKVKFVHSPQNIAEKQVGFEAISISIAQVND